jgi:PAS domain S-box-containing protein
MNNQINGKNDRVVRFHVRYAFFLFLVFTVLMAAFLILLARQYRLNGENEKRLLLNHFEERASYMDNLLAVVINRVEGLRMTAEYDLMDTRNAGTLIQPLAFGCLKETVDENGIRYGLDEFKPPVTASMAGNLTGEGPLFNRRDPLFRREIHMALNLNPQFEAVLKSIKDAAWVYYTSAHDFINIYPWVSSKDFRFSKELYTHEFFTLGLPEKNPARKLFWTGVYIDEYGKGLMTTCAAPVYDGDTFLGTVSIDLTVDFLNTIIRGFESGAGIMFLANDRDQLMAHPILVTSRDKTPKSLSDALPEALRDGAGALARMPDNEVTEAGSFSILKLHLRNAPWQIVYMRETPSFMSVLVRRIGAGALTLLAGLTVLVLGISVVTHRLFIVPSEKFVNFILARSRKDRSRMERDIPKVWRPWFDTIEKIFRENEELTERVQEQNEELERRVEERTAELEKANDRLWRLLAERERAEQALRESERKLADIVEFLPDATFVIDLDGKVIAWNRAIEEMTGIGKEDMLGRKDHAYTVPFYGERRKHLLDLIDRDDEELRSLYQNVHKIGNTLYAETYTPALYDGRGAHVFVAGAPLFDGQGDRIGAIESIRDITGRKRMEEERKNLEDRLRQAQKMEAIGTLAGGIAHDFNNLLMGIQGYATMARTAVDPSTGAYQDLQRIEELVLSGAGLSRQLLGFARGGRYEVQVLDIGNLLKDTAFMFGRARKDITVHEEFPGDLWLVEADRGQMDQMFMNLLVNAWQAMPGGGHIYLKAENVLPDRAFSDMHAIPPGRYVKLSITDTGVGMDKRTLERIFEPFFTTREMGRGTGLGLASVYGIVKGHGGTICVDSALGRGTTFDIFLPASEKPPAAAEDTAEGEIPRGAETVLVVDDELMVLDVTKRILERLGYGVLTAGSGSEALEIYEEKGAGIDVVLLDMIMPDMGGGETFERLKGMNPDVRVILASGYSFEGEAEKIFRKGCRGYLQKPFTSEELSQKIREAVGGGPARRE